MLKNFILILLIVLILMCLFGLASFATKWDYLSKTSFECGFSAYFYSRHTFSVHYFLVSMLFLYLDLELCMLMPFFDSSIESFSTIKPGLLFILVVLLGMILEWKEGKLDWIF